MTCSLTEETLLVRIRIAAILTHMTFVSAPVAAIVLAFWHNHHLDLRIGVLAASSGMETCVAPLAPQRFELWWSDLPGSSHEESTRPSDARLLLLRAVGRPVVIVTTEGTLPVAIVVVTTVVVGVLVVLVVIAVIVVVAFAMQRPAFANYVACFPTVIAGLFVLLGRHRSCDLANRREMDDLYSPLLCVVKV
jgi:hypothetical protein